LSWTSGSSLTLDSYVSIAVSDPVAVNGTGGLSLLTNDGGTGGTLSFSGKGAVTFMGLTNALTINGASYKLEGTVATLASDIGANSSGNYALAAPYNAKHDGTYSTSPIGAGFTGSLQGLGNAISNLTINDQTGSSNVGLFAFIAAGGNVSNLGLVKISVTGGGGGLAGGLVGLNNGTISNVYSTGKVAAGDGANVGGLVGRSYQATISRSHSSATITDTANADIGGLVGLNYDATITASYATGTVVGGVNYASGGLVGVNLSDGNSPVTISQSYATGAVSGGTNDGVGGLVGANQSSGPAALITQSWASGAATSNASAAVTGGLVGYNQDGAIQNSYATSAATAASNEYVGGLVGYEDAASSIADSYSTGTVAGGSGTYIGGLIGYDNSGQANSDAYWDTTTSGITNLSQGAGNIANDAGITGQTTAQLQAGLPAGFATTIWNEKGSVNGGLPYLIAVPPK
jgi:The GLUG motif